MLTCFGASDIGKRRSENQDAYATRRFSDQAVLAVVCDGMGGANGGKVASEVALSAFVEHAVRQLNDKFSSPAQIDAICEEDQAIINSILTTSVDAANEAVYSQARRDPRLAGMGTTLVSLFMTGNLGFIVNVGDSRLYRIGHSHMAQVTRDHSYVQMMVETGSMTREEAAVHPQRNVITRAVGVDPRVNAETFFVRAEESESFLLCSDGLHDSMTNEEIYATVWGSDSIHLLEEEIKVRRLLELANKHGGRDNITVILLTR